VVVPCGNIGVPVGDGDHAPLYSPGNLHVGPVGRGPTGVVGEAEVAVLLLLWPSSAPEDPKIKMETTAIAIALQQVADQGERVP
jgi:hypothetical protein